MSSVSYGVSGLKMLGAAVPDEAKLCTFANSKLDQTDIESLYEASMLAANVGANCKLSVPKAQETLSAAITVDKPTRDIYHAAFALSNMGLNVDIKKLETALAAAVKKDDSASSLAYAFHTALLLPAEKLKPYIDRVEDTVAQADEIDGKYLQFDGGISITAIGVSGIYALAEKANSVPSIKSDEAVKFANYLLSRKGVQLARPAFQMLKALQILTTNKYHIPVSFSLASSVALTPSEPAIRVKICNVMGQSVGPLSVSVDAAVHVPTSGVVISRQPLAADPGDKTGTLYSLNFLEARRDRGFYKFTVSAGSQKDKRLVGTQGAELRVKVMTEIQVEGVELSIVDREQMSTANVLKPSPQGKLSKLLEADFHQKLVMQFAIKDKATGSHMKIHQAFVVFVHQKSQQEIVFVAEPDNNQIYKFDVDLLKSAKDFDYLSGKYLVKLVLGDAVVGNPMAWDVVDADLRFPAKEKKAIGSEDREDVSYQKKPAITHVFRKSEKRPPSPVAKTFTALVLSPIVILLLMWLKIGLNVSGMPLSIFTLGFHLGLAGIFGLYFVFWLQLNMFQTLKYLAGIGGITFICGNRMLRIIAERRKSKTD